MHKVRPTVKRRVRSVNQIYRLKILAEIDYWITQSCANCAMDSTWRNKPLEFYQCNCKAAKKVRQLGRELCRS